MIPRLDLGVGESELGGQLESILDAEVLLALEALLQCLQLVVGERGAGLARLLAQAARRFRIVAALAGRAAAVIVLARRSVVGALLAVLVFRCVVQ